LTKTTIKTIGYIFYLFLVLFIVSCVQNKKLLYLQPSGRGLPKDSIINKYKINPYRYKLRANDIISVNIGSLTNKEFNFFQKYEDEMGAVLKTNNARPPRSSSSGGSSSSSSLGQGKQTGYIINDTGYVQLPILGLLKIDGMTIEESEIMIQNLAKGYFEDPIARVNILSFQFNIMGEVEHPGLYTSYDPEINFFEAISIAGNLTEFADRGNIKIIRSENNIQKIIYVNLLEEKFLISPYFYLKPDDVIVVAPLRARELTNYTIGNYTKALGIISTTLLFIFTLSRLNK
jgi:polysaccharide export outer membrane protein